MTVSEESSNCIGQGPAQNNFQDRESLSNNISLKLPKKSSKWVIALRHIEPCNSDIGFPLMKNYMNIASKWT